MNSLTQNSRETCIVCVYCLSVYRTLFTNDLICSLNSPIFVNIGVLDLLLMGIEQVNGFFGGPRLQTGSANRSLSCLRAGQFPSRILPLQDLCPFHALSFFLIQTCVHRLLGEIQRNKAFGWSASPQGWWWFSAGCSCAIWVLLKTLCPWIQWKSLGSHSCTLGSKEILVPCEYEPRSTCKTDGMPSLLMCFQTHTYIA